MISKRLKKFKFLGSGYALLLGGYFIIFTQEASHSVQVKIRESRINDPFLTFKVTRLHYNLLHALNLHENMPNPSISVNAPTYEQQKVIEHELEPNQVIQMNLFWAVEFELFVMFRRSSK